MPESVARAVEILDVNAVTLRTRDMVRAVRFYLGLGFPLRAGGETAPFTTFSFGSTHLNLTATDGVRPAPWGRVIFFVSDVDGMYERVRELGIEPLSSPRDGSFGERHFHVLDPDGHELSFARPLHEEVSYSTRSSGGAMLSNQGVRKESILAAFGPEVAATVDAWAKLPENRKVEPHHLCRDGLARFLIRRDGSSSDHWPSVETNDLSESFFREFAEPDGLWDETDPAPRCYELHYKALNEPGKLHQLVCPIVEQGRIGAFLVVSRAG